MKRSLGLLAVIVFSLISFVASAQPTLRIAVAANFSSALKQIAAQYTKDTGQVISITVSSSGTLYAQILHGAGFDIFFSADMARPNALVEQGIITRDDVYVYALGKLALVSSNPSTTLYTISDTLTNGNKLAIANPKLAPYGVAAKEALTGVKQWDNVSSRIVTGKNVLQAFQFFTTGNATAAIVAQSLLYEMSADKASMFYAPIPEHVHAAIKQGVAITATDRQYKSAARFVDYVLSDAIQSQLSFMGYKPVVCDKHCGSTTSMMVKQ
ncbi:molybdate ABC transporter substrate-binding protein [Alteromonas sp.]|nr:molybdate ABC transporter substrate-binding protein [Alteromonas sp.]